VNLDIFGRSAEKIKGLLAVSAALALSLLSITFEQNAACADWANDTASIKSLYDQQRYGESLAEGRALLTNMKTTDTDFARIESLVTMAAIRSVPLNQAAKLARQAYTNFPNNPIIISNLASVEMLVGDHQLTGELFEKALQLAPGDFLSHVGLAETRALDPKFGAPAALPELAKAESASENFGLDAGERWLIIGNAYKVLNEPAKSLAAYLQAEKFCPLARDNDKHLHRRIEQAIFRAALLSGDLEQAKKRLSEILADPTVPGETIVLTVAKLTPPGEGGKQFARQIYAKAGPATAASGYMRYLLARAYNAAGQDDMALDCFASSTRLDPRNSKALVAYAAQLAKVGRYVAARQKLVEVVQRENYAEPTPQSSLVQGLAWAGLAMLRAYDSNWASGVKNLVRSQSLPDLKTAYANLSNLRCYCRLLSMQHTLRVQPGVIFVCIPDDKSPVGLIVYDSKKTKPAFIWDKIKDEATVAPLAKTETISDFYRLVQLALDYAEAEYKPVHSYFNFDALPLRSIP